MSDTPDDSDHGNKITSKQRSLIEARVEIEQGPPNELDFLHASFAHVALPRSKPKENTFMRRCGNASIHLSSGVMLRGGEAIPQPLPYGVRPRQFLIYATTFALKKNTREVEIGRSMRELMTDKLGYKTVNGGTRGSQTMFKQQLYSLIACRMTLGWTDKGRDVTQKCDIFTRLDDPTQWYFDHAQSNLWPATATLSAEYLASIKDHAFPVDPRAISALDSALAIDIYCWLSIRLHKLHKGLFLYWSSIRDQFGQDYSDAKDFKKAFSKALTDALHVYPAAKIQSVDGGLMLLPSPSPVATVRIVGGLDTK